MQIEHGIRIKFLSNCDITQRISHILDVSRSGTYKIFNLKVKYIFRWVFLECIIKTTSSPFVKIFHAWFFFTQLIIEKKEYPNYNSIWKITKRIIETYKTSHIVLYKYISILLSVCDINSYGFKLVLSKADKNIKI